MAARKIELVALMRFYDKRARKVREAGERFEATERRLAEIRGVDPGLVKKADE